MSTYKAVTLDEFKQWAEKFPSFELGKAGEEYTFRIPTTYPKFCILIYTSIGISGNSRSVGEDAIRIVLFDTVSNKPIAGKFKRVNRVESENGKTIFQRIEERIKEVELTVASVPKCQKCGAHLVERTNRTNGTTFFGCSSYPNCGKPNTSVSEFTTIKVNSSVESINECEVTNSVAPIVHLDLLKKAISEEPEILSESKKKFTDLVTEENLYPTTAYPYINYKFDRFNRVQSTILEQNLFEKDCNLVLGTATSTGKTISAELFIGKTLSLGKKVVYTSPLRSLTLEKFEDWQKTFPNNSISILTGDFTLTQAKLEELNKSDIICCTSEMLDVRSRNHSSERSDWIWDVGLIITDESHIIATAERGHVVEVGLLRFSKLVPEAKLLLLSATAPNVEQLQKWLTNLNGKETAIINSDWRPTKLEWHFIQHSTRGRYYDIQEEKMDLAIDAVASKPDEKFLVFVHDKNTGRLLKGKMQLEGIKSEFHNADLDFQDRKEIENSFNDRQNGLRVLISSPTLAWGSVQKDTLILLKNGQTIEASQIKKGMEIVSFNEQSNCFEQDTILQALPYKPEEEYVITLEDGKEITVDGKHPIYVENQFGEIEIVEAKDLKGDEKIVVF